MVEPPGINVVGGRLGAPYRDKGQIVLASGSGLIVRIRDNMQIRTSQ
jgi:hypothetical protein